MKKKLLISGIIMLSFVLLILSLLITTYFSETIQTHIIKFALKQYNRSIPGEIRFKEFNGNIFQKFTFHHLSIHFQQQEILHLKSLSVQYNTKSGHPFAHFKNLRSNQITINQIHLDSLYTHITSNPDSSLNIIEALKPIRQSANKETKQSNFTVNLPDIQFKNSLIHYQKLNSINRQDYTFHHLNFHSSVKLNNGEISAHIHNAGFSYNKIPVKLKEVSFKQDSENLYAKMMQIDFGNSQITGQFSQNTQKKEFQIHINHLDTHDISQFSRTPLLPGIASIKIMGSQEKNILYAQAFMSTEQGNLDIKLKSLNLQKQKADFLLTFNHFNPLQFTHEEQLLLDGQAEISIQNFNVLKSKLKADLRFNQIQFQDYQLTKLMTQIEKENNQAVMTLFSNIATPMNHQRPFELFTQLKLQHLFNIDQKLNQNMGYEGWSSFRKINPGDFFKHEKLNDSIDLELSFRGKGLNPEKAGLTAELNISGFSKDHLAGFDDFKLKIDKQNRTISANLHLNNIKYDSLKVSNFHLYSEINTDFSSPIFIKHPTHARLTFQDIRFNNNRVNELILISQSEQNNKTSNSFLINSSLSAFAGDSLNLNTNFTFNPLNFSEVLINELDILFKHIRLKNKSQAKLILNKPDYAIEDLKIAINKGHLDIDAQFKEPDQIQADIGIKEFLLSDFNTFIRGIHIEKGIMNWDIKIANTIENPLINSEMSLNNLIINTDSDSINTPPFEIDRIRLKLNQDTENTFLNTNLKIKNESILLSGTLPLYINHKNIINKQIPDKSKIFNLQLQTGNTNLSQFSHYLKPKASIRGMLNSSIRFYNTLTDIKTEGQLTVHQGQFQYPEFGTLLNDINISIRFNPNKIMLDSLVLKAGKGFVTADGIAFISLKNGFSLDSLDFGLLANQAQLLQSPALESKLNALLYLSGDQNSLMLSGRSELNDTKINIDKLLRFNSSIELTPPLLLKSQIPDKDSIHTRKTISLPQADKIGMNVLVTIPKNTWIKGKDMNIETTGSVQLIREDKQIILNGQIQLLRGYYSLYGKRFDIESAVITFKDNKEFNPDLDIKARYRFREGNERRILILTVGGTIKQPQLAFILDGEEISEPDAISYILFGRNMAQLSRQEKSSVNNEFNAGNLAASLLINSLTNQINDRIKDILHLDLVDITGSNQYGNTEIQIGKYFGERLFLSYFREFNVREVNATQQETMKKKYQISKNLYLQSQQLSNQSSGIDLIFKWEK